MSRSIAYRYPAQTIPSGFTSLICIPGHCSSLSDALCPPVPSWKGQRTLGTARTALQRRLLPPICCRLLLSDCTSPPPRCLAEHSLGSPSRCLPKLFLPGDNFTNPGRFQISRVILLHPVGVEHKAPRQNGKFLGITRVEMELWVNKIAHIRIRRLLLKAPKGLVKRQNHTFFCDICIWICLSECESQRGEFGPVSFVSQDVLY